MGIMKDLSTVRRHRTNGGRRCAWGAIRTMVLMWCIMSASQLMIAEVTAEDPEQGYVFDRSNEMGIAIASRIVTSKTVDLVKRHTNTSTRQHEIG